jgi:FtsP/CotA-like multicopper oxidase with cupredoxin domain
MKSYVSLTAHRRDLFTDRVLAGNTAIMNWKLKLTLAAFIASLLAAAGPVKSAENAKEDPRKTVREYFIAAEDQDWDFAPSNKNLIHCMTSMGCEIPAPWTDSHKFPMVRYIQYSDAGFKTPVPQPEWLGSLGPIIRAEVGDTIKVKFCNNTHAGKPYGMHPHGVRYDKDSEGAHYTGVNTGVEPGAGSDIAPGQCFTYTWLADKDSGPAAGDPSSKVWWYHSHISEPLEASEGLLGTIIITRAGSARADASPVDVDKEFVVSFFIYDKLRELEDPEPGLMHSMNGYIFGNLKGLIMKQGEKVRWHVVGMGNEVDLHTPHWHGNTVTVGAGFAASRTDVVNLLPAAMVTADMTARNPGEWMFHCHVADHIEAGMMTSYLVTPK